MADATATTEPANDIKVEEVGPARKRLTITIPAESVSDKFDQSIGALTGEAALPGFRKGRAPRQLIERRFGESLRTETRNQLVADAYAKAIEAEGIKPLGEPEPDESMEDLEIHDGKPLKFSVFVEVVPVFELPSYERVAIKKPAVEIEDANIDDELQRQCLRFGTPEPIDGDYVEGDRFICRATATKDGDDEPFFRHDEVLIIHTGDKDGGRGSVLGLLVDGLSAKLVGKQVGDAVDIEVTGPEGHENEDIRGVKVHLHVEIKHVLRIAPATIKGVMDQYGMETEDVLREQIRLALEQRRDQDVAGAMREQVFEYLLDKVELALPEKLSAAQVTRGLEAQRFQMLQRGMTTDEVEGRLAEIRAESESRTRDRLKLSFILHSLADELKIDVSEQEVNGHIASVAGQRGARPEQLRSELVQSGQIKQVAAQLREQKTADRIVALADVTEISVDEWRKLREGDGAAATAPKKKTGTKKTTTKKTSASASSQKKTTKKTSKKTSK